MSTIEDVAKRAGVSKMTVSRVINKSGYASRETRERVERAIEELGYVPNLLARSLRFKTTKTIALVLTDITNPFFTTIARGVEDTASERGFSVIFCNTDESQDEEAKYLNVLVQKQVDGIVLVPACCTTESVTFLRDRAVPVVILDRRIPDAPVDTVRCDSERGAYELTRHLVAQGHTEIAVLSGPSAITTAADRVAGFQRALKETGLDAAHVYYGAYSVEGGYRTAQRAIAQTPRPTALFAGNNFIAFGALQALREHGLRVPDDIALVAFDDLPPAFTVEPFLTVMAQPAYNMGRRATLLLLDRLTGKGEKEPQEIILPTELIVRPSSALRQPAGLGITKASP
jgi:LacI family transcriptional regulator